MEGSISQAHDVLALTDENLRLVNINLLLQIRKYDLFGMKGLYEQLHASIKGRLSYNAMKTAIRRDLENLQELANAPAGELRKRFEKKRNRKYKDMLQIRIVDNQFLLNNVLNILGIKFEDLFDKRNLQGIEEEIVSITNSTTYDDLDKLVECLQQIEKKMNELSYKINENRNYKNFIKKNTDLRECMTFIQNTLINNLQDFEKNGFALKKNNQNTLSSIEIHGNNYILISVFINKMHQKNTVHSLLDNMKNIANDDIMYGRFVDPLFLIVIVFYFFIGYLESGVKNNHSIFQIIEGNLSDIVYKEYDNRHVLEMINNANDKTIKFIKHILKNEVKINEKYCVKHECLFVNLFNKTNELFSNVVTIYKYINQKIINFNGGRKAMEDMLNPFLKVKIVHTFGIKKEQLEYLNTYIDEIEELQIGLEPIYKGNYDVMGQNDATERFTPAGTLPAGSN